MHRDHEAQTAAVDAVRFADVRVVRGDRAIVDDVSFAVRPGEIVGLLGRNGAGKSTCLRLLNGLITPDAGTVTIWGQPAAHHGVRRQCGYVPEEGGLDERLTGVANLLYSARLFGVPNPRERIRTMAGQLGFSALLQRKVRTLSKGEKQRLALGRGILHRPDLLLLDEPTSGLDVDTRDALYGLVRSTAEERGAATIIASHVMEDIVAMCQRVVVLERGRILHDVVLGPSATTATLRKLFEDGEVESDEP